MATPSHVIPLWQAVEERLRARVPAEARRFYQLEGWFGDYDLDDPAHRREVVNSLVRSVRHLRNAGLIGSAPDALAPPVASDGRWRLLRDLNGAYHRMAPEAPGDRRDWFPVSVSGPALNLDTRPPTSEIILRFDNRVSRRTLIGALRRSWPELIGRGWLRRTRPLGDRALALIRFVCLETPPGTTWRSRLEAWDTVHPHWAYRRVRALERGFRRAEQQLTGEPFGLQWFYEPASRLNLPELFRAGAGGDRRARAFIKRSTAKWRQINESLGRALAQRQELEDGDSETRP